MVSQTPPARQANGRRRPDRRERPAGQQPRHLAQYPELTDNSPAAMKLIGIAMLTEINGDVKNRNLSFQLDQHEDFADSDLGEITAICPEIHDLAVSKCAAGRDKDADFVRALLKEGMIDAATLEQRIRQLDPSLYSVETLVRWAARRAQDFGFTRYRIKPAGAPLDRHRIAPDAVLKNPGEQANQRR